MQSKYTKENWFENAICNMAAILSQSQCVKMAEKIYKTLKN